MADEPKNQPDNECDGDSEDEPERSGEDAEEGPVATCVTVRFVEVKREQLIVASVGLPGDEENVSEERDGANE